MRGFSLSFFAAAFILFALYYFGDLANIRTTQETPEVPSLQITECGAADQPCFVDNRRYNIALPQGEGPFPVFLFFHGSGGSGDLTIASTGLIHPITRKNYAVIAPSAEIIRYDNGIERENWVWEGKLDGRDDYAFVNTVLRDASRRFPIDRNRILVAGHSRGGAFVWYFACANTDRRLKAFAPSGGTPFIGWENDCTGKTPNYHLIHTHGTKDDIVNFAGTPEKPDWYARHGAESAVEDHTKKLRCRTMAKDETGPFALTRWSECIGPYHTTLATFEGGHEIHSEWAPMVIDWFEALPR